MKNIFTLLLIILVFGSCKHQQKVVTENNIPRPLILVSKDTKASFQIWLLKSTDNQKLECLNMYPIKNRDSIKHLLRLADGIIISGGVDIYPGLYGKLEDKDRCGVTDQYRDSLELLMISYALQNKIPLLGVCRGHQILNISQGGSLIIDIPEDIGSNYLHRDSRMKEKNKSTAVYHNVYVEKGTFLYNIVKVDSGNAYSNHHQAVEKLALSYISSSFAKDKIIESIEPKDTLMHPFILGVQWHPEAMDIKNPLSGTIGRKFMYKVNQHFLTD